MAHEAQIAFCNKVRAEFPTKFNNVDVLDIGSMDINGNNRYLFNDYRYTGIDLGEGPNVDIVCPNGAHNFHPLQKYGVVISTECLEHDRHYEKTIQAMCDWCEPGGIVIITCATKGRPEHGTNRTRPKSSPFTNDYYKNLTIEDLRNCMDLRIFSTYEFELNNEAHDLYFYGVKRR